jgi:hypothetical protein
MAGYENKAFSAANENRSLQLALGHLMENEAIFEWRLYSRNGVR